VETEKQFYVRLGFKVAYEAPGFVALAFGEKLLFGLQEDELADPKALELQMYWQIGVRSVSELAGHCERERIAVETPMALQSWGEWTLALCSPNGYRVVFEGPE
jgi:hypothetical protein